MVFYMYPISPRHHERLAPLHPLSPKQSHQKESGELFILPKQSGIEKSHSKIDPSTTIKIALREVHHMNEKTLKSLATMPFYQSLASYLQ